jgi:hypothetical protein
MRLIESITYKYIFVFVASRESHDGRSDTPRTQHFMLFLRSYYAPLRHSLTSLHIYKAEGA